MKTLRLFEMHGQLSVLLICLCLQIPHLTVLAVQIEQLFMCSVFHDTPFFHHVDTVCIPGSGESV